MAVDMAVVAAPAANPRRDGTDAKTPASSGEVAEVGDGPPEAERDGAVASGPAEATEEAEAAVVAAAGGMSTAGVTNRRSGYRNCLS